MLVVYMQFETSPWEMFTQTRAQLELPKDPGQGAIGTAACETV